jgi:predicted glycoside hydrolase/deacetylase ChbG (UPF0249 family)
LSPFPFSNLHSLSLAFLTLALSRSIPHLPELRRLALTELIERQLFQASDHVQLMDALATVHGEYDAQLERRVELGYSTQHVDSVHHVQVLHTTGRYYLTQRRSDAASLDQPQRSNYRHRTVDDAIRAFEKKFKMLTGDE